MTASWRDHPQRSDVQLWLDAPTAIFKARVNQATFSYATEYLAFDTVTLGAYSDIEPGMTVLIGSTDGADDRGRIYACQPAESGILRIGRADQGDHDGEINPVDNAFITVLDDYRVWARLPQLNAAGVRQTDGYRAFADYGQLPPVIVLNCGPAVQADVDAGTSKATFAFDASASYAAEPGATLASTAYTLPAGATVTAGAADTASVTFTLAAGAAWLKLVVTDSNGMTQTRRVRLIAANEGNLTGWTLQPWEIAADGQTLTAQLRAPVARATYPDGTLLVAWHKETYAGVVGSLYGPAGSEQLLFCGWLDTEDARSEATSRGTLAETTLRAVDVAGRMKQLMTVPISTGNEADADSWDEMASANIDKLMVRTLNEYSSALTLCDFVWSGTGAAYSFTRWDASGGALWDVLSGYATAMGGGRYALTCDEWGRLAVRLDPQLVEPGDRTATVQQALTEADWTSLEVGRDRAARTRFLWGKATVPTTTEASSTKTIPTANAVAPGLSGGQGEGETTLSGFLATSAGLVTLLKQRYARDNAPDGDYQIALAHGGPGGISPAAKQWITVTQTSASAAQRGETLTAVRMLPKVVRVSYDATHGLMTRTVTAEKETVGVAAVAFTPKQRVEHAIPYIPPPGLDMPLPTLPPPLPIPGEGGGGQAMATFWSDNRIRITSATWARPAALGGPFFDGNVDLTALANWGGGTLVSFIVDAYSPLYLGTGTSVDGWLLTTTKVQRITDIFGTPALSTAFTLPTGAGIVNHTMQFERGVQNWGIVTSYIYGVGVKASYTTDGLSWTTVNVSLYWDTSSTSNWNAPIYLDPNTAGKAYTMAFLSPSASGASLNADGFVTSDYGASWAQISDPNITPGNGIAYRIDASVAQSGKPVYFTKGVYDLTYGMRYHLYRADGSGAPVDISPVSGGLTFGGSPICSDDDPDTVVLTGFNYIVSGNSALIAITHNARAASPTWSLIVGPVTPAGSLPYRVRYMAGTQELYLLGAGALAYSRNGGVTLEDKIGDIVTSAGAVGLCGGAAP